MDKIGEKIKNARKKQRITQEDLAQAIGVSDKSISAYESDRISPPIKVLEKIAKQTEQSLGYFLEEKTEDSILARLNEIEKLFREIKDLLKK